MRAEASEAVTAFYALRRTLITSYKAKELSISRHSYIANNMRKKVDSRVRTLIENGVKLSQRSLVVLVGDKGRDQVVNLHYMLSKARAKTRPSVLWCYKKELGFTTHQRKRMKQMKREVQRGVRDPDADDQLFISHL